MKPQESGFVIIIIKNKMTKIFILTFIFPLQINMFNISAYSCKPSSGMKMKILFHCINGSLLVSMQI